MNKYIVVVISFLIVGTFFAYPVVAEEVTPAFVLSPTPVISQTVDYTLAYPGLLPDHPLYFLKAFRDQLLAFLISNPVKKADFDLLQADKRVEASYLLATQKKKIDFAQMTFSKGENYFDQAIVQVRIARQEGNDMREFVHKLELANRKHQEVLVTIKRQLTQQQQQQFSDDDKRLKQFVKTVSSLAR